jgi:hypothetical protein
MPMLQAVTFRNDFGQSLADVLFVVEGELKARAFLFK